MAKRPVKNRSIPNATVIPVLQYSNVPAAVKWLCSTFGFKERLRIGTHRVQLVFGSGAIVVAEDTAKLSGDEHAKGHSLLVRVPDVDAHCIHAKALGARVIREPETHPYGERQYTVLDLDGHSWTFSQSVADSDPKSWGGELVGDA